MDEANRVATAMIAGKVIGKLLRWALFSLVFSAVCLS